MTDVISLNLTDLRPDGEPDPISEAILGIAVAAAKVVVSPADYVGAAASLHALRESVRADLPHLAELIDSVMRMLLTAEHEVGGSHG